MALSANSAMGTGLTFTGMSDYGILQGFDLQYNIVDKSLKLYLCVGKEDNRVLISGTTRLSRQPAVLDAIDQFGKWGENIQLWMVSEKNGVITARTNPVNYLTHVKPFYGNLTVSGIAADQPSMTYPGNGKGRLLSKLINNRYYFIYAGKLEKSNQMRGFDCTSFPMALLSIPSIAPPGYGSQLCNAVNAANCGIEQIKSADLSERFKNNTIPNGLYILFSEGHIMLYNSNLNILYEFNYGGFKSTPAGARQLQAHKDLWWMRKLDEKYRPLFT